MNLKQDYTLVPTKSVTTLCDSCGAEAVVNKEFPPLSEIWGTHDNYWVMGKCERCGKVTDVASYL